MVLSIGSRVDLNRPLGSLHGEAYHHLARAAVCEIPLMEEPDFDVLHALVRTLALRLVVPLMILSFLLVSSSLCFGIISFSPITTKLLGTPGTSWDSLLN
jgi:hypothetical protein